MRDAMFEISIPVAFIAAVLGGLYWIAVKDAEQWAEFSAAHNCRKVAHVRGHVQPVTTFGANGQAQFGTTVTPDKTGWLCDDGVTYYR